MVARPPCLESRPGSLVGVAGFEPATPASRTRCATGLRYTPTGWAHSRPGPVATSFLACEVYVEPRAPARHIAAALLGRSQVVRQRILIPPFPGSNPGAPANQSGLCGAISEWGENRRHSCGLCWRAWVSGRQFPDFQSRIAGFHAPVSARHFPISVSVCRRPVRYVTETGSQSRTSGVERDAGVKSAA